MQIPSTFSNFKVGSVKLLDSIGACIAIRGAIVVRNSLKINEMRTQNHKFFKSVRIFADLQLEFALFYRSAQLLFAL